MVRPNWGFRDWNGTQVPPAPPAPPPGPVPPAGACHAECVKACPGPFSTPKDCQACTRLAPTIVAVCKPKDRNAYCNTSLKKPKTTVSHLGRPVKGAGYDQTQ